MNKVALAASLASRAHLTQKAAEDIVEHVLDIITEELVAEREVVLAGFGAFSSRLRHARRAINPSDKKTLIDIAALWVPKFKAGRSLKDALKRKTTHMEIKTDA
jgi:nucleoid DNA-binding protein